MDTGLLMPLTLKIKGRKTLDLVIFGATGYTGKVALQEMANIMQKYPDVRWGIAGRSPAKLAQVLHEAEVKTGLNISEVKIIEADVCDERSLRRMCEGTKVVVNCCGPYVRHGEPVVAATVAARAHYVDVSAENQFNKLLHKKYDRTAKDAGVCIITSCGLCSVPVDLGIMYMEQRFRGTLHSVESYLRTHSTSTSLIQNWSHGIIKYSSWESLVYGLAQNKDGDEDLKILPPQIRKRPLLHKRDGKWYLPYPISDTYTVSCSQKRLFEKNNKRPVQYRAYIDIPNFMFALTTLLIYLCASVLAKATWTRRMLLNYPRLCTFGIVAYERDVKWMKSESVYKYKLRGKGWDKNDDINKPPAKDVIANISVRGADPAYVGTAVALLQCAITLLYERENMPAEGGVMTPGYAFYNTDLLRRLQESTYTYSFTTNNPHRNC